MEEVAIQSKNKKNEGRVLFNLYQIYKDKGNNSEALKKLISAYKIQVKIGDKKGESTSLNSMSFFFSGQEALKILERAYKIDEELRDNVAIAKGFFNRGNVWMDCNDIESAINCWIISYKIAKELDIVAILNCQISPRYTS